MNDRPGRGSRSADHEIVDLTTPPPGTQPRSPEKSLGELLSDMTADLSELTRKEVELAKLELREEGRRAARAGALLGVAGIAALTAVVIVAMAGAWLLDLWMPRALAFLLIAVALAVVAAVVGLRGRDRMREIHPVPEQTVETLKEDVAWARAQRS